MEYIDPQKARQERERQERERQARIKAEKDRKAKIEAEKKRQAKIEAEKKRKAKLKAKKEAAQKAEEEATKKAKKAEHPDKKPTDPKLETKKPTEQKPENKKPQSEKKSDDKTQTEITWSKPGEASPIYSSSAPTYSSISSLYGQPSVPISKGSEAKPKPEVPSDREARTWTGEQADPQPKSKSKSKSVEEPALEALRARVLLEDADKLEERRKRYQNSAKQEPEVSEIFKQPSFSNGSLSLGTVLTNPLMGATLLSGTQTLGQPEKTHPSESIKVASAHGHGIIMPATPEQQLHHQFESEVAAKAQGLLKANKDRLNIEQKAYAQDSNPKSDRWSHLWQIAAQQREFKAQHANLQQQYEFTTQELNSLSDIPDGMSLMSTPGERQNSAKHKKLVALSDQKQRLKERIAVAKQMQVSLEYAYPALSAVKGETGTNPQDIQTVQGRLPQEFNGIRRDINRISQWLTDDPSNAWLFDSVVAAQLKDKSLSPPQRQQLMEQAEKAHPAGGIMLGAALSGGLFAAALVPALEEIAVPLLWSGIGVGATVAAAEIPDLMLLDGAAQAGRGGAGKLTSQSPEQARFNLVMGYANVALAGLDVGAEVKVIRGLERVVPRLSGQGAQVLRQSWGKVMSLARQGNAGVAQAQELLMKAKGVPLSMVDEVMEVLSPMEEIVGVGRMSRSEMRGQTAGQVTTEAAVQKAKGSGQKKPKDMTPAERLAYSQGKYAQVKNWDEVEPLIGIAVNQNTQLPAGYRIFQKPGSKQLFILRETADDGSFVPLMIESGKIQAGKTRLSRGRKVMEDALKAIGIDTPKGYQLNHLVPDAVAQSDPMMVEMLKRNLYDVDHAGNLLPMPGEVRGSHPDLIGHYGSHENYNNLVELQLERERVILVKKYGSLNKVPDYELKEAVKGVEDTMREEILNRSPDIPTRYDPATKTRVLSEGLSDPDFVA